MSSSSTAACEPSLRLNFQALKVEPISVYTCLYNAQLPGAKRPTAQCMPHEPPTTASRCRPSNVDVVAAWSLDSWPL
ncbi:hypothetical protein GOP47_0005338 [Adiantum capillus-veneris]|uniref:Uncharacterized protein n=1 Tax=Adiantum capillus-veneris TaxID=13818 RepID=A0A9D4V4Y6_ADICA|nr:hypothetical protein GOP47_0005338 [Adiantum capillus-veneris]